MKCKNVSYSHQTHIHTHHQLLYLWLRILLRKRILIKFHLRKNSREKKKRTVSIILISSQTGTITRNRRKKATMHTHLIRKEIHRNSMKYIRHFVRIDWEVRFGCMCSEKFICIFLLCWINCICRSCALERSILQC